jgi:DNA polymerase I-like protein with 3'-5' exonuclease and polymerase domains
VLNETQGMLSLESLTTEHFGFNIKEMSPVDRKRLDDFPVEEVLKYNAIDAKYHLELYLEQEPLLEQEGLVKVYKHQLRRIPTLVLTQMKGVPINQSVVKGFRDDFEAKLKVVEDQIAQDDYVRKFARKYGHAFNEGSTHDIRKFLTDIGQPNTKTDEVFLAQIKDPLIPLILKRRKLLKVLGTYVQVVSEAYVDRNGEQQPRSEHLFDDDLLHPIISTTKVKTSRTSSEEPNVQNWPKRNENVMVRKQVEPGIGEKVYAFDYAGIQARNVAMESKDPRLVKAFWDRYDIHTDFMEKMIDVYPRFIKEGMEAFKSDPKLAKHYRHIAKNKFVFPTFFGAQPKRVATDCGLFPEIKNWQLDIQSFYKRNGYVTGLSGYRRRAPVGWNELINAPIQADEAMIVMEAMSSLSELDYTRLQPTFEIHDDLTFIFPVKHADKLCDMVIREMVKPRHDWINVPLVVEMSVGDNWCDLKHISNFENKGDDGSYVEFK